MRTQFVIFFIVSLLVAIRFTHAKKRFKDPDKCGKPTCRVPVKFGYRERTDYVYRYSAAVSSRFDGAGEEAAETLLSFDVHLRFRTPCHGVIKLSNANLFSGTTGEMLLVESENLQLLEANILRFYYDDGNIAEICPELDDPVWVMNIKRSVLSSLQNTMERFDVDEYLIERDINGDCLVGYFFKEVDGTTLVIDKKLDVSSCVNRYQVYSIIPMTPYIFQKKYHKWTPINSTIFCNQHIDHKVLVTATCEEKHQFQPFYNQTNGAKAKGKTKLTLLSESPLPTPDIDQLKKLGEVKQRKNLLFDHKRPTKASHDNLNECKQLLLSLCEINLMEFKPKYTEYFNRFIHVGRDLSVPALRQLYNESQTLCPTGHIHMMDALPFIRSRAATEIMVDIINERTIDNSSITAWLLIMTFYPRPDGEIVEAVSKLLQGKIENTNSQTLLTLTTIVHNYCERSPAVCGSNPAVRDVVDRLEENARYFCRQPDQSHGYSILKALANAGVMTPTLNATLKFCITNSELPLDLRLEAVQAHRRLPCEANRHLFLEIYRNKKAEDELRIASYQQLMRCPSYAVLRTIRNTLFMEEYNQVGSFVWSHLKTQMKSSFPSRVEVQAILQDEYLGDKFDKDFRKFSRNYETSFYLNRYGIGVFLETNVIFSYRTYVPRTVTLNGTICVFGETLNVFEVTFYFRGLEEYFEEVFHKSNFIDKKLIENIVKLVRRIRSAPNPLEELIKEIPYEAILDKIKVSISFKMFGNEVNYLQIHGMDEFKSELEKLNPMTILKNFFSGQEIEFNHSSMMIDMSYVTPMMVGTPLKLNAIGTAAVKFDALGFINATRLKPDSELEVRGRLVPSLGVSLECSLEADSFIANAGAKFKGTVYTSTAIEGTFTMRSLKFIQIAFNLPLDKSDIFHAETHLFLMTGSSELELKGATGEESSHRYCSWNLIDETIGLRLCANTLLPSKEALLRSPIFFLSGPLQLGVTLEKSDPTAKLYILEYRIDTVSQPRGDSFVNKTVLVLKFDTPGSVTKRGLKAVVDLDPQSQNLTLAYQSNLTRVQAQGYYRNTPEEMLINFGLDINGQKHIDMKIGVEIMNGTTGSTVTISYYPKLLFAINGKRVVELSGSISWVKKSEISQSYIELDLATNRFETKISGYGRLTDVSVATNLRMDYRFGNVSRQTVRFEVKLGNKSTKFLASYLGHIQMESTAYPEVNLILTMTFQKAQSHTDCHMNMITNPYVEDDKQKLRLRWHYQLYKAFSINKRNITLEINKPSSNIDFKFAFFKQATAATSTSIAIIRYSRGKEIVISFDLNIPHGSQFYFENRLKVSIPSGAEQMSCYTKIFEKSPRDYDLEFVGVWFSGHNLTMRGMYQDRSDPYISSHTIKILARSQLFDDLLLTGRFLNFEAEMKTDVQVEHKESSYGLGLAHKSEVDGVYETFGELIFDSASYTFTCYIDLVLQKTRLDLHLDTYRDLNIALHGISNESRLDAGLHVKWDANRDPSQKFNAIIITNSYGNLNGDGKLVIEYPGRAIKSSYTSQHESSEYLFLGKIEWGPKGVIFSRFFAIYDMDVDKIFKVDGEVETPFINYEYTSLHFQTKINPKDIKSNGTLTWQSKQKLELEVLAGYNFTDDRNYIGFVSIINSSIPEINSMKGIIRFEQVPNKVEARFVLQSSPINILALDCSGEIQEEPDRTQYLLAIGLITPFQAFHYAKATGELNLYPKRRFKGLLHINGNGKKYMTTLEGSLEQLRESKLNFHMASPEGKWKQVAGRFSFSASRKHFLTELKTPTVSVGAEVVYIYFNLTNFDLKLKCHASSTYLENILIIGKRNVDTVDARFGWNKHMVGLIGRSHYQAWNDVDYSLQLFTPFEGYDRVSAIGKLLYAECLDLEIYINAGSKKVGIKVQGMKGPEEDFAIPYKNEDQNVTYAIEPFDFEVVEHGTTYFRGVFQLDTSLYPTVHGFIQINEDGSEYNTLSYFSFPFGQLKLTNSLDFKDLLNLKNQLEVETSCNCFSFGELSFSIEGVLSRHIVSEADFKALIFDKAYQAGAQSLYKYTPVSEENDSEGHYNITLDLSSSFPGLKKAYTNILFEAVSPVYVGNFSVQINNSTLYTDGTLENDGSIFITDLGVEMNTPLLVLPMCRLQISRDFTDFEKEVKIGLAFPNQKGDSLVNYGVSFVWHYDGPKYMKYILSIITPFPTVGTIKSSVHYSSEPKDEEYYLELKLKYAEKKEITIWNSVIKDVFNFHVISTHEAFRNMSIKGKLRSRGHVRSLDAVLSLDKEYKMFGSATINPERPFTVDVKLLKTITNEPAFAISLKVEKNSNRYDISSLVQRFENRINIICDYIIVDDIGKLLNIVLTTNYPGYEKLIVYGEFLSNEFKASVTNIEGEIESKWITTKARMNLNVSIEDDIGVMSVALMNKNVSLDGSVNWVNEPLEHLLLQVSGAGSYLEISKSLDVEIHFWNIENEFSEISFSTDVNYNKFEWWLSANTTLLWPYWNDFEFVAHAILPHKNDDHHVTLAKVFYDKNFNHSALLLKYSSNPKKFNFEAIAEFLAEKDEKTGVVLLETGKHKIYDRLVITTADNEFDLHNLLQSTNLKEVLVADMIYRKPDEKHHIQLVIYYPEPNAVMSSVIQFSALNNLEAQINCSTPFKAFKNIQGLLKLITTRPHYLRFVELLWGNQSAVLNYTHVSSWTKGVQLTDGEILVDFPLASRHQGLLDYHYQTNRFLEENVSHTVSTIEKDPYLKTDTRYHAVLLTSGIQNLIHLLKVTPVLQVSPFLRPFINYTNRFLEENVSHTVSTIEKDPYLKTDTRYHAVLLTSGIQNLIHLLKVTPVLQVSPFLRPFINYSTEVDAVGYSRLSYNSAHIMSGNYSRQSQFTKISKNEVIKISVNNSYIPTGIIYTTTYKQAAINQLYPNMDFKRIELYKLNNTEYPFNVTGEMEIHQDQLKKNTTLRAMHSLRKLVINTLDDGKGCYSSLANFTFKTDVYIAGGLRYKSQDDLLGKDFQIFLSYPRRYFILSSYYDSLDDNFMSQISVQPNQFKSPTKIVSTITWKREPKTKNQNISVTLGHPSFVKNLSVEGRYSKSSDHLGKLELDAEYSSDINKKISFYSYLKNVSVKPVFHYEYNAHGEHPASRLKITGFGYVKIFNRLIDFRENITYKRSYQPMSFWYNAFKVDFNQNFFELERNSLRDLTYVEGKYAKDNQTHVLTGTLINGKEIHVSGHVKLNPEGALTTMDVNLTSDGREKLRMDGFYKDHRYSSLRIWRQFEELYIPDLTYWTKLNHSRLLTFGLLWRPDMRTDFVDSIYSVSNYITTYASETATFWSEYFRTEIYDSMMDIWFDAKPIIQDFLDDVWDVEDLQEDIEIFKVHFQQSYENNEFFMQDMYQIYTDMTQEMTFKDRMSQVPKIVNELWEVMGETGETIRKSILWLVESVKKLYYKVVDFIHGIATGETLDTISKYLERIAGKYDKIIRDMHISFLHFVEGLWNDTLSTISFYWSKTLRTIEPTFIQFAHYIESVFWEASKKVFEFLYARQSELLKSSVFAKNANLTKNLDVFYEDLTKNDFITNMKKYSHMLIDIIREQYFSIVPFGYELNEIGSEIATEMKELYKLPLVNFTVDFSREIYNKATWIYDYFNVQERAQRFLPFMYKMIIDYSHTALENEMINHGVRTKFIFEPERGQIMLEEKLPMPWHAFNETPNYREITEYKIAATIQKLLTPSNFSFLSFYYKLAPLVEPMKWLPPFGAQAIIIGNKHFVTFDGNHFEVTRGCTYLLSHDFREKTFSLVLKEESTYHVLVLVTNVTSIYIDLRNRVISLEDNNFLYLPMQIGSTSIYAQESIITIEDEIGFTLHCNFKFESCSFQLSGWYFGKVSGLLGTMDNEPRTDMYRSDGQMSQNDEDFVASWALGLCKQPTFHTATSNTTSGYNNKEFCYSIFRSKSSPFSPCFTVVDPAPYSKICYELTQNRLNDPVCSSAFSYLLACRENFIPLKLPAFCVVCPLPYGETLEEGDFTKMEDESVPQSTDVVFIVEAKECNQFMRDRRIVHTFSSILSRELYTAGINDNRYAVVTFGGNGVFDMPSSVVVRNQVFTSENELPTYFQGIISGNGNTDIFSALKFATKLQFRAGVSKTFILIPCSDCDLINMTVEYNVLNQAFLEQNITLHVLMNAEFDFEKLRVSKMFYGLDSERAFTKSDFKVLKGDMDLRRQIKLTKSMMGYCTSLALETNGTIFTGKKMGSENLALVKKFSSVFARRIAASAYPDNCQSCECVGDDNGIDFIDCIPCSIPIPAYSDFEFQENGTLTSIWPTFENIGDPDFNL